MIDILTPQELSVARLVSEGLTNQQIAARMYLSAGTVRNYVSQCLSKLYLPNRASLTAYMLKHASEKPPADPDVYKEPLFNVYAR